MVIRILIGVVSFLIGFLIGAAIVAGLVNPVRTNLPINPPYCTVGDDNCDGIIMSYESGWRCVPPSGGPLTC